MRLQLLSPLSLLFGAVIAQAAYTTLSSALIFRPPANYTDPQVLYPRTVELGNGVLLATWENYSPEPPMVYFPIYQSLDHGATWAQISEVTDQVNGWGLRYQPFLYLMPVAVGAFPAGTILLAGNSIPTSLSSTPIDVYASLDQGFTWNFVSHVALGGAAVPDNGVPAIWEPFILTYQGQIVIYYSDQRDSAYGQKLVHQVSSDLLTWGDTVNDVAYPTYTDRPGMATITQLPNGNYMMTYEYGGGPRASGSGYAFPVYYRISSNPLLFNNVAGVQLVSSDGTQPTSSPFITWSSVGGVNGTIIVSAYSNGQIFENKALGASNGWTTVSTPQSSAYARDLRVLSNPNYLLIMSGGYLPPSTVNKITVSVVTLS